jgi:hypothetical protein
VANRIEAFQVTVPAGTAQASPVDTQLNFLRGTVVRIQVMIPPGPSGLVGFAFVHSFQQIIPFRAGEFIVADDETITWDVERYPEAAPWVLRAYNEDIYDHTLYLRFSMSDELPSDLGGLLIPMPELDIPPGGIPPDEDEDEDDIMALTGDPVDGAT